MTVTPETSVRDIVAEDFRAAAVFERFGIDFCCGGRCSFMIGDGFHDPAPLRTKATKRSNLDR